MSLSSCTMQAIAQNKLYRINVEKLPNAYSYDNSTTLRHRHDVTSR